MKHNQRLFFVSGFSLIELMIALSLGALLCIGVFNLFNTMLRLHEKQMVESHVQEKMRFMAQFFREKIAMAGNGSCEKNKKPPRSMVIRKYNADQALDKLGLTIKPKTDLLQLRECIRFHDRQHYLPIEFFIANTYRTNTHQKSIYALFMKINHHPREELMTDMTRLRLTVYHCTHSKKNRGAVKMKYTLASIVDSRFSQRGVLYVGVRKVRV